MGSGCICEHAWQPRSGWSARGRPAPLSSYTWKTETPLAAARLVYLSTSSVLACTGLGYTRGSPTPPGGDAGARSSTAPPASGSVLACTGRSGEAPRSVLCPHQKKPSLGLRPTPKMPFGPYRVALSPFHSAALCGQGGGPRDSRYTCATKNPGAGDHHKKSCLLALGVAGDTNPHGHPIVPDDAVLVP